MMGLLSLIVNAWAEVIVLKNGRSIIAENVWIEGEKVFYEGESGRVSLPKSLVVRIEEGSGEDSLRSSSQVDEEIVKELTGQIQMLPPDTDGIVRNGKVDEDRLRSIASMANQGELELQTALRAYLIAAVFETLEKRIVNASRWAEDALRLARRNMDALLLAAHLDIAQQRPGEALDHLLLAQSMAPDSPDVLTLLGYAYYATEGPEKALRYWRQAYSMRPDDILQARIRKAESEGEVVADFTQTSSSNFQLSWEGSEVPSAFSREVLQTLESLFQELQTSLDYVPREPIPVVLYTQEQFANVTRAPDWVSALNDGKIRVPVQGMTSMNQELRNILKHEMVHSFIHQMTGGRCPVWLNEGLAQRLSGDTLQPIGVPLARRYAASRYIPLENLEGSFISLDPSDVALAYGQSLAAASVIESRYGAYQFPFLLKAIADGATMEQALRQVLRLTYQGLEEEIANDLIRRYGR